jgi:hypothetical protein
MRYSIKYALVFGLISGIAGEMMTTLTQAEQYDKLWMFTSSASAIVAFTLSYFFIEKKPKCSNTRTVVVGTLIALLSHWLCWCEFILFDMYTDVDQTASPLNLIYALGGALGLSVFSLMFMGWTAIPTSIFLSFKLKDKSNT